MAYEDDRLEREDGGGSFLMGLLAGTVLGAGLGMLFAPKAGAELRNQLNEQAGKLRSTANDTLNQVKSTARRYLLPGDRTRSARSSTRARKPTTAPAATSATSTPGPRRPAPPARPASRPRTRPTGPPSARGTGASAPVPACVAGLRPDGSG